MKSRWAPNPSLGVFIARVIEDNIRPNAALKTLRIACGAQILLMTHAMTTNSPLRISSQVISLDVKNYIYYNNVENVTILDSLLYLLLY